MSWCLKSLYTVHEECLIYLKAVLLNLLNKPFSNPLISNKLLTSVTLIFMSILEV